MNKTNEIQSKTVDAELSAPVVGKTPKGRLITPFNLGYAKTKEFYGKVVAKSERNAVIAGLQKVAYAVATVFAAIVETLMNMGKFALNTAVVLPINFVHGLVTKPKKGTDPVVEQKKEETPKVKKSVISDGMVQILKESAQEDKKSAAAKTEVAVKEPVISNEIIQTLKKLAQEAKQRVEDKKSEAAKPEVAERKAEVAAESVVNEVIVEQPVVEPAVTQDNRWIKPRTLIEGVAAVGIVTTAILYALSQSAMESVGV